MTEPSPVAIAYVLQKTPYVFPIVGGRKVEQLNANIEALEIALTKEHIKAVESVVPFDLGFPHNFFVRGCCACLVQLLTSIVGPRGGRGSQPANVHGWSFRPLATPAASCPEEKRLVCHVKRIHDTSIASNECGSPRVERTAMPLELAADSDPNGTPFHAQQTQQRCTDMKVTC